jgi:hypothetical protein
MSAGLISFGIFVVFSIIALLIFLFVPLLHILGQYAGYRVLKGENSRYPLIGKLVERKMAANTPLAADGGVSMEGKPS